MTSRFIALYLLCCHVLPIWAALELDLTSNQAMAFLLSVFILNLLFGMYYLQTKNDKTE